jgi:hypothetical protein
VPVPAVRKRPLAPFFIAPPAHPALGGSNWVLFCRVCTLVHLGSRWSMARWGPLQLPSSPLRFWVIKVTTAAFLSNRMVLTERSRGAAVDGQMHSKNKQSWLLDPSPRTWLLDPSPRGMPQTSWVWDCARRSLASNVPSSVRVVKWARTQLLSSVGACFLGAHIVIDLMRFSSRRQNRHNPLPPPPRR